MSKPTSSPSYNSGHGLSADPNHVYLFYEGGSATTIHDLAPSGAQDGTVVGSLTWGTSTAGDPVLTGAGGSNYVSLGGGITLSQPFSVAWRAWHTAGGGDSMPFGDRVNGYSDVWYRSGSILTGRITLAGGSSYESLGNFTSTSFTSQADDYVLSVAGNVATVYKNGSSIGVGSLTSGSQFVLNALFQGYPGAFQFAGSFDYLYTFPAALTATDAANLHSDPYRVAQASSSNPTAATLSGPTSGVLNVASASFVVTLDHPADQTYAITFSTSGSGTFSNGTPSIAAGNSTTSTTYTPTSSAGSPHSIDFAVSPTLTRAGRPIAYAITTGSISIASPVANQPRWWGPSGRTGNGSATFTLAGSYSGPAGGGIEWSKDNVTWSPLVTNPTGGTYSAPIVLPTGNWTVGVRFAGDHSVAASVPNVTVGPAVAVGGQSNGGGRGTNPQVAYPPPGVSFVMVQGDGSTVTGYAPLADPASAGVDPGAAGSWMPAMATALGAALGGVPVIIIPTAVGSSGIATWQPGSIHYTYLHDAIAAVGGCDGVAWWQGEADGQGAMSAAAYAAYLRAIGDQLRADFGCPLVCCLLQTYSTSVASAPNQAAIRAGQLAAIGTHNVLRGPDFAPINTLASQPSPGDPVHIVTDTLESLVGGMWAASFMKAVYAASAACAPVLVARSYALIG